MNPKLYDELASWWPLLSAPKDYAEEAEFYEETLKSHCRGELKSLLELGSGGGNNAFHLKRKFDLTLVDRAPGMLTVSQRLNPECEHVEGDMRTVRLGREFDGVFVHDAISYMDSVPDLRRVLETAYEHCRPGGAALFVPDWTRESFRPGTDCGGHDGDGRGMRYLEWTWDPDPEDTSYTVDFALLLRDTDGSIRVEHDRHTAGLFPRQTWMDLMTDVGFTGKRVPYAHSDLPGRELEAFVGRRVGT